MWNMVLSQQPIPFGLSSGKYFNRKSVGCVYITCLLLSVPRNQHARGYLKFVRLNVFTMTKILLFGYLGLISNFT